MTEEKGIPVEDEMPKLDQKQYEAQMKHMIKMLKIEHEYQKIKSEIMQYKAMEYQAMEVIAGYQAKGRAANAVVENEDGESAGPVV
jgi:hypothetical protein